MDCAFLCELFCKLIESFFSFSIHYSRAFPSGLKLVRFSYPMYTAVQPNRDLLTARRRVGRSHAFRQCSVYLFIYFFFSLPIDRGLIIANLQSKSV